MDEPALLSQLLKVRNALDNIILRYRRDLEPQ